MITFPTTVETFVACNGETVADLDATTIELLDYCVSIFNGAFYAGTKGEAPVNIINDAAEDYAQMGALTLRGFQAAASFYNVQLLRKEAS